MTGREGYAAPRASLWLTLLPEGIAVANEDLKKKVKRATWSKVELQCNLLVRWVTGTAGRGMGAEDIVGVAPWVVLTTLSILLGLRGASDLFAILLVVLLLIVAPLAIGAWSAAHQVLHVRNLARKLDLEQLLLTRLSPLEVVMGLHARPLAIQRGCLLISYVLFVAVILGAEIVGPAGGALIPTLLGCSCVVVPAAYFMGATSATCGCLLGLRECLLRGVEGAVARAAAIWIGRLVGGLLFVVLSIMVVFLLIALLVWLKGDSIPLTEFGVSSAIGLIAVLFIFPFSTHEWSARLRPELSDSAAEWQLFETVQNPDALPRRAWRWWWRWLRGGR